MPAWPYEVFRDYLRALMDAKGIRDYAELSRLSGVSQTQLSHWRRGQTQPSRESLKKIAPALGVRPVQLYIAAGLDDAHEDLDLGSAPDMTVWPAEFRDLLALYERANDDERLYIRRSLTVLTAGLRAETGIQKIHPFGRRRPA